MAGGLKKSLMVSRLLMAVREQRLLAVRWDSWLLRRSRSFWRVIILRFFWTESESCCASESMQVRSLEHNRSRRRSKITFSTFWAMSPLIACLYSRFDIILYFEDPKSLLC